MEAPYSSETLVDFQRIAGSYIMTDISPQCYILHLRIGCVTDVHTCLLPWIVRYSEAKRETLNMKKINIIMMMMMYVYVCIRGGPQN
jgi:hypothetical protein